MASCRFTVDFNGSASELITKAKTAIEQAGGSFNGTLTNGTYALSTPLGDISGLYTISGQTASFEITDKPFLVSCGTIEKKINGYLNPDPA